MIFATTSEVPTRTLPGLTCAPQHCNVFDEAYISAQTPQRNKMVPNMLGHITLKTQIGRTQDIGLQLIYFKLYYISLNNNILEKLRASKML